MKHLDTAGHPPGPTVQKSDGPKLFLPGFTDIFTAVLLFKKTQPLQAFRDEQNARSLQAGFVPTMGALHDGHLALIRRAVEENDIAICSIFVNPTQFNQSSDLDAYPRLPGNDIEKLVGEGCNVLFLPGMKEIYPGGTDYNLDWDPGQLDAVLEGKHRPGHFRGVAQVVKRLLDIVRPQRLYMGQKDFQQVRVVEALVAHYAMPVEVIMHEIVREADGLAMSSRNTRLHDDMRARASALFQSLIAAKQAFREGRPVPQIEEEAIQHIRNAGLEPEYFQIVDGTHLQNWRGDGQAVACVAAWAGDVRLIDNMILN